MNGRTPLIIAAVATAALAGCSNSKAGSSAAPTGAPGPTAGSTATGSSAAPAHSSQTSTAGDGCTPSEATLLEALRSSKIADALAPTKTLTDITCYQGYALGQTHPKEADNAEVVFRYTGGAWHAVNGGTSEYCDGVVPAAVRPHLEHC